MPMDHEKAAESVQNALNNAFIGKAVPHVQGPDPSGAGVVLREGKGWPYQIYRLPGGPAAIEAHLVRAAARQRHLGDLPGLEVLLVRKVDKALTDGIGRLLGVLNLDVDFALVGGNATYLHAPYLGHHEVWIQQRSSAPIISTTRNEDRTPFTDLGLWTVKALIVDGMPKKDLRWPPALRGEWKSADMLAKACGCGLTTMNRLLLMFEERGWLAARRRNQPYYLAIPLAPLEAWCNYLQTSLRHERPVQRVFGSETRAPLDQIKEQDSMTPSNDWRIGGWHAIDHHGIKFVTSMQSKPVEVITANVAGLMRRWGLVECDPRDADFVIMEDHGIPMSVMDEEGMRWSDPLTAALEVITDTEQGPAQAESIMRNIADSYQAPSLDHG